MATGGRVLHHLEVMLPHNKHTVLIVGYAAAGTRTRRLAAYLVHGEPEGSAALAERLTVEHGWCAVVPRDGEQVLV